MSWWRRLTSSGISTRSFGTNHCRVRRFWQGKDDQIGCLVHKSGSAEHARWVFDYDPETWIDDDAGYRFGAHKFSPGE